MMRVSRFTQVWNWKFGLAALAAQKLWRAFTHTFWDSSALIFRLNSSSNICLHLGSNAGNPLLRLWWRKPHAERVVLRPLMISQASLNSTLFPLLPSSHWNVSLFNRATTLTLIAGVQTTMFFFALFPVVHNWNEWKVNSWSSSSRVLHNNGDLSHREKMKETCPLLIFEEWVEEIRGDSRKIKFF